MLPIHQPNVEVHRIEMNNGSREFCQEFMTDVIVPDTDRVGDGRRRAGPSAPAGCSTSACSTTRPYVTEPVGLAHGSQDAKIVYDIARSTGGWTTPAVREIVGEARMLELVVNQLSRARRRGHPDGPHVRPGGRARPAVQGHVGLADRHAGLRCRRPAGAAWTEDDPASMSAINFLMRQAGSIGGGTTEMARNVISERVLGMPRERRLDKDVPFRDVPRSRPTAA